MSWEVTKYKNYARECMRLAEQAGSVEARNKLIELAQVWSEAALVEQQAAHRLRAANALRRNATP
ncbi:MAG: hypothetical protein C5B56_13520 [Proteobacteria bacterium]|nr:MAG: hypothetical protein C5B56_13520 [Pseudomonadota bacterium]